MGLTRYLRFFFWAYAIFAAMSCFFAREQGRGFFDNGRPLWEKT